MTKDRKPKNIQLFILLLFYEAYNIQHTNSVSFSE